MGSGGRAKGLSAILSNMEWGILENRINKYTAICRPSKTMNHNEGPDLASERRILAGLLKQFLRSDNEHKRVVIENFGSQTFSVD